MYIIPININPIHTVRLLPKTAKVVSLLQYFAIENDETFTNADFRGKLVIISYIDVYIFLRQPILLNNHNSLM